MDKRTSLRAERHHSRSDSHIHSYRPTNSVLNSVLFDKCSVVLERLFLDLITQHFRDEACESFSFALVIDRFQTNAGYPIKNICNTN